MFKMVHKNFLSVKQFAISFLLIDFLVWLLVGGTCAFSYEDCADISVFGPFFYYLPWSQILSSAENIPFLSQIESFPVSMTFIILFLSSIHAGMGALLGFLLRKNKVSWKFSIFLSALILIVTAVFFARIFDREELENSTQVQLWEVLDAEPDKITFQVANMIEDDSEPNGFELVAEEGVTTHYYESFEGTEVILIDASDTGLKNTISYEEYLEARTVCQAGPCDYYDIGGIYDLFEVTYNRESVLSMEQVYLP